MERLHGRENFGRAVLNKIEIDKDKRRCEFTLVTDAAYTPEDEAFAEKLAREAVPASLAVSVKISKLVADAQLVRHKIVEYLSQNHRAAAAFVTAEDIGVEQSGGTVRFTFGVDEEEKRFFETRGIVEGVAAMLENSFCNKFEGALVYKDKGEIPDETEETDEDDEPLDYRPARTFKIHDFEPIDFADVPKVATYIKDCTFRSTSLTVCGKIEFIQERTSQKGKPYLRFTVSDPTARMSFSYFIKKKTEEKVRALQPGDWIVCTGENEFFNDRHSRLSERKHLRGFRPGNDGAGQYPDERKDGRDHGDRRGQDHRRGDPRAVHHPRQPRARAFGRDRKAYRHHRRHGEGRAQDRRGHSRFL